MVTGFKWTNDVRSTAVNVVRTIGRDGFLSLAEDAKKRMEPFVPYDTGKLVNSAVVSASDEKGQITYDVPYAKAVYYGGGVSFSARKHPQATAFWADAAQNMLRRV